MVDEHLTFPVVISIEKFQSSVGNNTPIAVLMSINNALIDVYILSANTIVLVVVLSANKMERVLRFDDALTLGTNHAVLKDFK
jgi:hypothetical protein